MVITWRPAHIPRRAICHVLCRRRGPVGGDCGLCVTRLFGTVSVVAVLGARCPPRPSRNTNCGRWKDGTQLGQGKFSSFRIQTTPSKRGHLENARVLMSEFAGSRNYKIQELPNLYHDPERKRSPSQYRSERTPEHLTCSR